MLATSAFSNSPSSVPSRRSNFHRLSNSQPRTKHETFRLASPSLIELQTRYVSTFPTSHYGNAKWQLSVNDERFLAINLHFRFELSIFRASCTSLHSNILDFFTSSVCARWFLDIMGARKFGPVCTFYRVSGTWWMRLVCQHCSIFDYRKARGFLSIS